MCRLSLHGTTEQQHDTIESIESITLQTVIENDIHLPTNVDYINRVQNNHLAIQTFIVLSKHDIHLPTNVDYINRVQNNHLAIQTFIVLSKHDIHLPTNVDYMSFFIILMSTKKVN